MNTTGFIEQVRDQLSDPATNENPDGLTYTAESILRAGDQQLRSMFRALVTANGDFANFTMGLRQSDARQILSNLWEYRLPTWITSVVSVAISGGSPSVVSTYSVYRWTPSTAQIGTFLRKTSAVEDTRDPHWSFEGPSTLRLRNFTSAQDLLLLVAVRPAKMTRVKVTTVSADADAAKTLYLPATAANGQYELEEGSYINSSWQVTTAATANAPHIGDVRRCIYSTPSDLATGTRQHRLYFEANWSATLAANDILETVLPLPDEHCRLLVLRTAQACLQRTANLEGLRAIAPEILRAEVEYLNYATPSRDRSPKRHKSGDEFLRNRLYVDPNGRQRWW